MKYKKIVVTGGSGMVGRSLKDIMPEAIYLSSKDYNLTSEKHVAQLFFDHNPDCIIHLAAKVGGIIDNINKPAEYFTDNILMNTLLVDYAVKNNVKRFIGIFSTCIYPDIVGHYPMKEEDLHKGAPTATNFSYGYAKRCLAVQTDSYNQQYNTNYQYLIPCNLYGEHDKFGDNSHFIAALIKKIHKAKVNNDDKIILFGTGLVLRQFMHSNDLAYVIKYCLDNNIYENMNVAIEDNLSIKEMAKIALKAMDAEHLLIEFDSSKPNGQFRKDVSIQKLKKYIPNFEPLKLHEGIKQTYEYLKNNNKQLLIQ